MYSVLLLLGSLTSLVSASYILSDCVPTMPDFDKNALKLEPFDLDITPSYILARQAFSEEFTKGVTAMRDQCVEIHNDSDERVAPRWFGTLAGVDVALDMDTDPSLEYTPHDINTTANDTDKEESGLAVDYHGHEVTFLNDCMNEDLYQFLRNLLHSAVRMKQCAWREMWADEMQTRVIEYLRYWNHSALGWHYDEGSFFTIVIGLTDASEYEGGLYRYRTRLTTGDGSDNSLKLSLGDFLIFPSTTTLHRVTPVTRGIRNVFVLEWHLKGRVCEVNTRVADKYHHESKDFAIDIANQLAKDRAEAEEQCENLPEPDNVPV